MAENKDGTAIDSFLDRGFFMEVIMSVSQVKEEALKAIDSAQELKTLEELKEDFKKAFEQNGIMELFIVVTKPMRKHTMNTTISANV